MKDDKPTLTFAGRQLFWDGDERAVDVRTGAPNMTVEVEKISVTGSIWRATAGGLHDREAEDPQKALDLVAEAVRKDFELLQHFMREPDNKVLSDDEVLLWEVDNVGPEGGSRLFDEFQTAREVAEDHGEEFVYPLVRGPAVHVDCED